MISIDADRLLARFLAYVRIDSPTGEEAAFARVLTAELEEMGLPVYNDGTGRDGAGNLLAVVPGGDPSAPAVLLCTHMDTVEPGRGIRPRVENGVVVGDGTTILGADNKASVAACLEAVRALRSAGVPHGEVELLFTWGEERGHQGARAFDTSRLRSRLGFVPDGGGPLGQIINRAPYHQSIRAVFHGRAAHAGVEPENGISALVAAARAASRMALGRIDEETTANLGRISGGTARNTVPDRVEIEGEARSLDEAKLIRQLASMRAAAEEASAELGARCDWQTGREYDGFHLSEDEPAVRVALAASRALGLPTGLAGTGGGSDANDLNAKGIPTVVLGMGGLDFHSPRERIAVADLTRLAELLAALVLEAARRPDSA